MAEDGVGAAVVAVLSPVHAVEMVALSAEVKTAGGWRGGGCRKPRRPGELEKHMGDGGRHGTRWISPRVLSAWGSVATGVLAAAVASRSGAGTADGRGRGCGEVATAEGLGLVMAGAVAQASSRSAPQADRG